jgi:glycosyltransferase involved in cell wall biosynthesis
MKILLNAVSAKMGGAATYIKNLAHELAALSLPNEFIFFVPTGQAPTIRDLAANIRVVSTDIGYASFWKRLWFDQVTLRRFIKREQVDVLYSTANLGMFACPCRQVLLVRNSLHFSKLYLTHILPRKGWYASLENAVRRWLICQSTKWADIVMTPSQTMLDELCQWVDVVPEKTLVNHYGIKPGPLQIEKVSQRAPKANELQEHRLLYTSLYAEHKNLSTLLRSLMYLIENGICCRLITSADPNWQEARITSTWREDARLVADPRISNYIEFIGVTSSEQVATLYHTADVFVYPSLVESFGHPLVEAMAAGMPIVAADTPINREICQNAAVYFSPLDAYDCARQIQLVLEDQVLQTNLIQLGLKRSKHFRWKDHIEKLLIGLDPQRMNSSSSFAGCK